MAAISADSLRGNLSFIAADLLEGRDSPSRGLDIAALYIAAQFRRAALEPAGDDGYFQTAKMLVITPPTGEFKMTLQDAGKLLTISPDDAVITAQRPIELTALICKVNGRNGLSRVSITGKVVMIDAGAADEQIIARAAAALHPAAFLLIDGRDRAATLPKLVDPDDERVTYRDIPRLIVHAPGIVKLLNASPNGDTGITISIRLSRANTTLVNLRNVAAVLRGSDSLLRNQYVLLTAHYDHLGCNKSGAVFPGANDDGSGIVSVIEIAQALATMPVHPKRSIVFVAFFGEEEGSLGSRYYAAHPLFPLDRTVADLNLEQLGRTDSRAGPEISNATLTGFRYSTISRTLEQAGGMTGVTVYDSPGGDDFFDRSDNQTFADHGIPAHTLAVALEFKDYHAPGDVWQKIDYSNMAKVDRMIALGMMMLADSQDPPAWNRENPKVAPYLKPQPH